MVDESWQCPRCYRTNSAKAKLCTKCGYFKGDKIISHEEPKLIFHEERKPLSLSREGEENELLRGKLTGIFEKEPIILTNKKLTIAERAIDLDNILEVYSQCGSDFLITESTMIVRLKDNEEIEVSICPERSPSIGTALFGDAEGAMIDAQKATHDRWVNLINRLLK